MRRCVRESIVVAFADCGLAGMVGTVLEKESFLFSEEEMDFFVTYKALSCKLTELFPVRRMLMRALQTMPDTCWHVFLCGRSGSGFDSRNSNMSPNSASKELKVLLKNYVLCPERRIRRVRNRLQGLEDRQPPSRVHPNTRTIRMRS